ncbi:TM0106 family RecB-like putative nuclease [Isoptericola sp. 4D.3]|uniref:TM0106 family RecB-like putative nuclease n=1 Tax=Isoptericola peretonis TaxID=2918523 RepID=A0ABT0J4K0_9MICO|nr:TM0106 family RecB-like putative nuclease [Isoptericola sp. 4D.3]
MFLLDAPGHATAPLGEQAVVHSASDLVVAAECEFRLLRRLDELLGRVPRPEREDDVMLARTAALGAAHERRVLDEYVARFGRAGHDRAPGGVVEVEPPGRLTREGLEAAHGATLAAVEAGADVVAQASFFDGEFHGRADFLVRDPLGDPEVGPGRPGEHAAAPLPRYAVLDTKLARRAKVTALLQLAAYADQLAAARVDPTDAVHLVLGTRVTTSHRLAELLPVLRRRRARLRDVVAAHRADDGPLAWGDERFTACGRCEACAEQAAALRDVLLVGGVYEAQRARLVAGGITTIDALAAAEEPPEGMPARSFERVREQARLQLGTSAGDGEVAYDDHGEPAVIRWSLPDTSAVRRLPPPSPGDVFFDFEGDPLWSDPQGEQWGQQTGLDYLFGLVERPAADGPTDSAAPPFRAFWAHDLAQERQALVDFVDYLTERRRQYPDLHVYHYASYERVHLLSIAARHGVYEEEVDQLLRDGVLVDLYAVVRSSLRISDRSKSIKKLEPLYMGDELRSGVTTAAASIVAYAEYTALRDAGRTDEAEALLRGIADYNRYDCVSTLRLLDWLRRAADVVDARSGAASDELAHDGEGRAARDVRGAEHGAAAVEETARQAAAREGRERRLELEAAVRDRVGEDRGTRDDEAQALAMIGASLGYWRRESKPFWHEHYSRLELPTDEWQGRRNTFHVERAAVLQDWAVEDGRRAPARVLELVGRLSEGSELAVGAAPFVLYDDPAPEAMTVPVNAVRGFHGGATIIDAVRRETEAGERDVLVLREQARVGAAPYSDLPMALTPSSGPRADPQEQALEEATRRALARWDADRTVPDGPATDLMRRRPPRLVGGGPLPAVAGDDFTGAVLDATRRLDRSYLAVQGPPGTGKTHVGSHVVAALVAEGWRVGVVAQSHAAVENMLRAVVEKAGVPVDRVAKKRQSDGVSSSAVCAELSGDDLAEFSRRGPGVVGGTAWDFAHPGRWPEEDLDLLVVDEAGQFSIAATTAVARAAKRLLLLGDPQQLPQVSRGRHPEPVDRSSLGWLADGHDVLPDGLGYFLARSWRMHPALCDAVSQLAYEGRLRAHETAATRSLAGVAPGVHHVPVRHEGRAVASPEEAQEVVRQVVGVLGRAWTPGTGQPPRPLGERDVVVLAAYNAQVWAVRRALEAAGLHDVRVGTVDRFQGTEAPVAIVTLAASSPHDVPRGTGFLLSRHRINVAVSRGQWCAIVVRSPDLTDYLPRTPEGLGRLGAFLALCERAV